MFIDRAPIKGVHGIVPVTAGSFITTSVLGAVMGTIAGAATRLDFNPLILARDITVDRLHTYVTTGVAASTCRLGIYTDIGGTPGAVLADTGDLSCATSSTIASGNVGPLVLNAGTLYWLAVLSSSNQTYRGITVPATIPIASPDGSGTAFNNVLRTTTTYGALPATAAAATGGAPVATNSAQVFIALRTA